MKKDNQIYLGHILECIDSIFTYTYGMNLQKFLENKMVVDAVCRNLEIIGEAAKNIDKEFTDSHPHISWKRIAGLRDKLIHDYIGVDTKRIWNIVENQLPDLQKEIEKRLK